VVRGVEALGDDVGVLELIAGLAAHGLEAHREGREVRLSGLGKQPGDEAQVEPAREQHAQVDVGHEAALDGGAHGVEDERTHSWSLRPPSPAWGPKMGSQLQRWSMRPSGVMVAMVAGEELLDPLQEGERRVQSGSSCRGAEPWGRARVDVTGGQQRGQARDEAKAPARLLAQVQGLDAEPVAREGEAARAALVKGEGEHALQPLDDALAPQVTALRSVRDIDAGAGATAG
jgi:hypothetical protein